MHFNQVLHKEDLMSFKNGRENLVLFPGGNYEGNQNIQREKLKQKEVLDDPLKSF